MLAVDSSVSLQRVFLWLGLLFLVLLGLVTLCRHFINSLVSAFETVCDGLECWLAERKNHRHHPPSPANTPVAQLPRFVHHEARFKQTAVPPVSSKRPLRANRHLRIVSAQDALRRNAESEQGLVRAE